MKDVTQEIDVGSAGIAGWEADFFGFEFELAIGQRLGVLRLPKLLLLSK
jgi:hypothetical protein